jgi:predicted Zn-dependent peptidase
MAKIIRDLKLEDLAPLSLANSHLNDRMGMVLREQMGLAYSLGSSITFRRDGAQGFWGYWELSIGTRPENLNRAEQGIRDQIQALLDHTFTGDEIEKLVGASVGSMAMRDMPRIGQAFAMGVGEFLWGDPQWNQHVLDSIGKASPEAISAAASKFMTPQGLSTAVVK